MCTERKAPDSELQRSHQNCGSSVWNLSHVTLRHQEFGGSTLLENLCTLGIVVLFTSVGYNYLEQICIIKCMVPGDDIVEHCMMLRLGEA
jgi:hypothetical protein